ncbi:MAG: hypothetical protein AB1758_37955 [Candidatus Eremiobacterota bacterium]
MAARTLLLSLVRPSWGQEKRITMGFRHADLASVVEILAQEVGRQMRYTPPAAPATFCSR